MSTFDDIIKKKADDHEAPVPADAWHNIMKAKKKRRVGFFWWAFCILVCGLVTIAYFNFTNSINMNKTVARQTNTTHENIQLPVDHVSDVNKVNIDKKQAPGLIKEANPDLPNDQANDNSQSSGVQKINTNLNTKPEQNPAENLVRGSAMTKNERSSLNNNSVTALETIKEVSENRNRLKSKKSIRKENGGKLIQIFPGEIATSEDDGGKQTVNGLVRKAPLNNYDEKESLVRDSKKTTEQPLLKKDSAADLNVRKSFTTEPSKNKKDKAVANKNTKKHAWFIDFAISPLLPIEQYDRSAIFKRSLFLNNNLTEFSGKLDDTKIDPSLAFSLSVRREISKKVTAGIGLQYLQLKEDIHISGTETITKYSIVDVLVHNANGPELVNDTIKTITGGRREISATNSYSFLSIPLFVQYQILQNGRWSLGGVAGAQVNVYNKYKNEINRDVTAQLNSSSATNTASNKMSVSVYGGFRIGKMISKKTELFGLPFITLAPGTQNIKNSMLNKKIRHAGLNVGLSYKIN